MTLFLELSFAGRAVFGLWTLLLCLAGIISLVLACSVKRYFYALGSVSLFIPSYILWQVTVCFLYLSEQELTSLSAIWLGRLPYVVWSIVLLLLTGGFLVVLYQIKRYSEIYITPLSIEQCADELNCGICYWRNNGHVVFSNACMNRLSIQLTGKPLMDGIRLRKAITDTIMPVGDRVWQFSLRDVESDKDALHELIASDVTELYAESHTLEADNARLAKMNEALKVYGLKIDEAVRRQEMLQAKVNIHDEMNRLMLSTIAADLKNGEELNRIFALWERNALLLCMESNEYSNKDAVKQLEELAQALGIQLLWNNELPESMTSKQHELLFAAAQEAITNAVKHAQAKMMKISFTETGTDIGCTFENDGVIPEGDIHFTGGLANLAVLAEEQNASISAESGEKFRLSLHFSK
ncbi:MAG: hypothetical protein MJ116_10150 [Lachnospiraceae bacterium]|nr:hypothetical protein [Lachnospiraceae bacterium]